MAGPLKEGGEQQLSPYEITHSMLEGIFASMPENPNNLNEKSLNEVFNHDTALTVTKIKSATMDMFLVRYGNGFNYTHSKEDGVIRMVLADIEVPLVKGLDRIVRVDAINVQQEMTPEQRLAITQKVVENTVYVASNPTSALYLGNPFKPHP